MAGRNLGEMQQVDNEQRRNRRHRQTVLVTQLEELLPSSARRSLSKNGAGVKRSVGTDGRTMHDILQDALCLVRDIRSGSSPANNRRGEPIKQEESISSSLAPAREALLCAKGMLIIEVDFATHSICSLSIGAKDYFACSPFGSVEGFSLQHLLHIDDIASYEGMCEYLSGWRERTRDMGALEPPPCTTKLRVVHFFKKPRYGCRACDGGGGEAADRDDDKRSKSAYTREDDLVAFSPPFQDDMLLNGEEPTPAPEVSADIPWCAAEYVSFEFQVFTSPNLGRAQSSGVTAQKEMPGKVILMAPLHTAVPPVRCCVGTAHGAGGARPPCRHVRPVSDGGLDRIHRLSGQFVLKHSHGDSSFGPGKLRAFLGTQSGVPTDHRDPTRKTGLQIFSAVSRLLEGGRKVCMETLTDFVVNHLKFDSSWDIDGDGLPFCRLHWQMCFPGGFCTPWNYVSQNVIDCTPIEHLNHRGSSSKVLAVPVFTVHAHDEPGLKAGFGLLNFRCHPAACGGSWTVPSSVESTEAAGLRPFMIEHYAYVDAVAEMDNVEKTRLIYTGWISGMGTMRWTSEKVGECDRALQGYDLRHDRTFYNP